MNLLTISRLLVLTSLLFSNHSFALDVTNEFFYRYEVSNDDSITGIGSGVTFKEPSTHIGVQLNTSFNDAEVLTTDGYIEDYFAWEGSVRAGYFSTISLYAEAGVDLTELFFHDLRYDDDHHYHQQHDDIDSFIGLGAGIQLGHFKVEAFTRLREIDSKYWQAKAEIFRGVTFSINF